MTTHEAPQGPAALFQLFTASQVTATLAAAIQLDAFAKLADGPRDAAAVATGIGAPERTTRILLDALSAIGLLTKSGTNYALGPLAADHLVPGKPMYMGDIVGIFGNQTLWSALPRMADAVKSGGSVLAEHAEIPRHPFWETFAESSGSMAFGASMALDAILGAWIDKKAKVRVLDVACGSGIYGFSMLKHPNVELTLLDWPNVLEHTRGWGKRLGVDEKRVKYIEGNLFEVDYAGPNDVVLTSHVFHHFDEPTCASLMKKVAKATAGGGRVIVNDFLYDTALANPAAALFAVTMLNWTKKGQTYSFESYAAWMKDAGVAGAAMHAVPGMPTSFVVGDKS